MQVLAFDAPLVSPCVLDARTEGPAGPMLHQPGERLRIKCQRLGRDVGEEEWADATTASETIEILSGRRMGPRIASIQAHIEAGPAKSRSNNGTGLDRQFRSDGGTRTSST